MSGRSVGVSCALSFMSTGFHAHWHLIPGRTGDDKSPRGGVRGGYHAQTALLSGGLTFGRADEGDWGGIATPEARLAAAAKRPHQRGSQQGVPPDGPPQNKPGPGAWEPPPSPGAPNPSPTYERLRRHIAEPMRMSHIDQPYHPLRRGARRTAAAVPPAPDVLHRHSPRR